MCLCSRGCIEGDPLASQVPCWRACRHTLDWQPPSMLRARRRAPYDPAAGRRRSRASARCWRTYWRGCRRSTRTCWSATTSPPLTSTSFCTACSTTRRARARRSLSSAEGPAASECREPPAVMQHGGIARGSQCWTINSRHAHPSPHSRHACTDMSLLCAATLKVASRF